ncbi:probable ATP-dependent RNA helicase DDX46 [Clytia hemisphaerica]
MKSESKSRHRDDKKKKKRQYRSKKHARDSSSDQDEDVDVVMSSQSSDDSPDERPRSKKNGRGRLPDGDSSPEEKQKSSSKSKRKSRKESFSESEDEEEDTRRGRRAEKKKKKSRKTNRKRRHESSDSEAEQSDDSSISPSPRSKKRDRSPAALKDKKKLKSRSPSRKKHIERSVSRSPPRKSKKSAKVRSVSPVEKRKKSRKEKSASPVVLHKKSKLLREESESPPPVSSRKKKKDESRDVKRRRRDSNSPPRRQRKDSEEERIEKFQITEKKLSTKSPSPPPPPPKVNIKVEPLKPKIKSPPIEKAPLPPKDSAPLPTLPPKHQEPPAPPKQLPALSKGKPLPPKETPTLPIETPTPPKDTPEPPAPQKEGPKAPAPPPEPDTKQSQEDEIERLLAKAKAKREEQRQKEREVGARLKESMKKVDSVDEKEKKTSTEIVFKKSKRKESASSLSASSNKEEKTSSSSKSSSYREHQSSSSSSSRKFSSDHSSRDKDTRESRDKDTRESRDKDTRESRDKDTRELRDKDTRESRDRGKDRDSRDSRDRSRKLHESSSSSSSSSSFSKKRDSEKKDDSKSRSSDTNSSKKESASANILDPEEEMRKRKERIEAWRNARKGGDGKSATTDAAEPEPPTPKKKSLGKWDQKPVEEEKPKPKVKVVVATKKKTIWNLEDDDDEQADKTKTQKGRKPLTSRITAEKKKSPEKPAAEDDEEIDPLDAFMMTIDKEVNKSKAKAVINPNAGGKTVTVVKTVVKKEEPEKLNKPEVMEQNQDALEYSSEEETPADVTASDFTEVKQKQRKELTVDHSRIYYAAFRRNFYVEVPELARLTADEVKIHRDSLDIQIRGKNVPKPIRTWAQAGLSSKVMTVLKKCNYEKPTHIQSQAIPAIMSGRDMIGIAKTGSGKTLAFLLPMLRHVLDQPPLEEEDGPIAIIMTPTRELALQIFREGKKFCKPLQLSIACIYGGSGISEQIAELKRGAEIIVCTPGRMIDMLAANNGKVTNCRRCTYLVMDEADRMFDMGFEPQVMRIVDSIRKDRQTVLFSATFPRQMEAVARKVLIKPVEIQVGGRSIVCSDVEQHAVVIDADNRFFKLLELLGVYQERGSILVFVEKQETADSLFKDLLKKGYPCLSLHGGMDQYDRDSTIADFKNGVTKLMVSTSVAARGLDVKNLILVINYDCPNHYEDYVHRCGRTGRAGNKGTAFTFLTYEQGRNAGDIMKAFEVSKVDVPEDVKTLWEVFKAEMEAQGKKIRANSGFSGKGFKFNAEEDAQISDAKKMQKFTLGLQDSDDEAEAAENAIEKIEADLDKAFSNKPKIALAPEVAEQQKAQKTATADSNVDKDKLKAAADRAAMLNKKLNSGQVIDRNTAATASILQGQKITKLQGVGLAKQMADKVNAKLNYKPVEAEPAEPVESEKKKAVRYEEEIDINDFPQTARWRITSKEIIEQVREVSEAGVTVRGMYIPPSKKGEDEKRLHLYIESLSERSIQIAKAEIKRLLKEELMKHESSSYRGNTGRYKVV